MSGLHKTRHVVAAEYSDGRARCYCDRTFLSITALEAHVRERQERVALHNIEAALEGQSLLDTFNNPSVLQEIRE